MSGEMAPNTNPDGEHWWCTHEKCLTSLQWFEDVSALDMHILETHNMSSVDPRATKAILYGGKVPDAAWEGKSAGPHTTSHPA